MRKIIYSMFLLVLCTGICKDACATGRKKKTRETESAKQEQTTPYDRLFKGKNKISSKGLMTVHFMNKKVYLEFPTRLLGKDMLLTSMIEKTNNMEEGLPGQWSGKNLQLRFTREDSTLNVHCVKRGGLENKSGEENFQSSLENSNFPGIYKSLKIEAFTPDSGAMVIEATNLFMEDNALTNPFPANAGSAYFGFYSRSQIFQPENSFVQGIKAHESSVAVNLQLGYMASRSLLGFFAPILSPVTITCNRILLLLPEEQMNKRLADSRLGISFIGQPELQSGHTPVKNVLYTKRWRIEPSDKQSYARGELVEPKKPIVFYMDSLVPAAWRAYVKAAVEAWNPVFEKIGFKNTLQVVDVQKDTRFDPSDLSYSRIEFMPTWLSFPMKALFTDPRSGEIFSAAIYLPNNMTDALYVLACAGLMGSDPSVRRATFTDEQMGDLIKTQVMQTVGSCLGLTTNAAGSYAYPVDSLRSATFTQEYGLSASIMDELMYNYVAQPEDVRKGARTTPKGVGEYDYYAIKWLYKPIPEAFTPEEEKPVLDQWIAEQRNNPRCRYKNMMDRDWMYDPTSLQKDMGDDHIKELKYLMANTKRAYENIYEWYEGSNDRFGDYVSRLHNLIEWQFLAGIDNVASYIGGVYLNDVYGDDSIPSIRAVPLAKQREAVQCLLNVMKDTKWMFPAKWHNMEGGMRTRWDVGLRWYTASSLQMRLNFVLLSNLKTEGGYDVNEYVDMLYHLMWDPTLNGKELNDFEIEMQNWYVNNLITTTDLAPFDADAYMAKMQAKMQQQLINSSEDTRDREKVLTSMRDWHTMFRDHKVGGRTANTSSDKNATYFAPAPIRAQRVTAPALYFDMLKKCQSLLTRTLPSSEGRTRQHYEFLLKKIDKAMNMNE